PLTFPFRTPHSAFRILVFIAACTPATMRPPFQPYPAAPALVINARPARVIAVLDSLAVAESLRVTVTSPRDGYLETAWYDTTTRTSHATWSHVQIDHRVPAGAVGEPHREAEHGELARDVAQARHHVALARDGDDGPRPPLADHPARQLAARRDEHRHLVASRDREHAVQRLLREAPRDEYQQLPLPHLPPAVLRQRVVYVDRRVLHPIAPPHQPRDSAREVHELEEGAA